MENETTPAGAANDNLLQMPGLAAQAAALDAAVVAGAAVPGAVPGAAAPTAMGPADEAADLIRFSVAMLTPLYPSLERIYPAEVQAKLAGAAVPLLNKYGLTLSGLFEKWGPELNFAIVALPLVGETVKGVRADNAARALAEKAAASVEKQPEE